MFGFQGVFPYSFSNSCRSFCLAQCRLLFICVGLSPVAIEVSSVESPSISLSTKTLFCLGLSLRVMVSKTCCSSCAMYWSSPDSVRFQDEGSRFPWIRGVVWDMFLLGEGKMESHCIFFLRRRRSMQRLQHIR